MKYKYLKRFNEAKQGPEMTFDDFKSVMADLVDEFDFEYEFHDYSEDKASIAPEWIHRDDNDNFYDVWIYMTYKEGYELHEDIPYMNLEFLDIRDIDSPGPIEDEGFEEIFELIDGNKSELERVKNDLDDIIERNKKTKQVFEILKDKIIPRFNHFANFKECGIGFNSGELRITFDIDDE